MLKPEELLEFVETYTFVDAWEDLGLNDEGDLSALQAEVMHSGKNAPVIQGTGGLRKLRFAPPAWNVGKSGALRVCFAYFPTYGTVLLVMLYAKNEKANLSTVDKRTIKQLLDRFEAALARQKKANQEARLWRRKK